jgi:hypothetical protein
VATKVKSFAEIKDQFDAYIGDIVYATMTTVDARGRPAGTAREDALRDEWSTPRR